MVTHSSKTSGTTYPATQRHVPEDPNPRLHRCGDVKIRRTDLILPSHLHSLGEGRQL